MAGIRCVKSGLPWGGQRPSRALLTGPQARGGGCLPPVLQGSPPRSSPRAQVALDTQEPEGEETGSSQPIGVR